MVSLDVNDLRRAAKLFYIVYPDAKIARFLTASMFGITYMSVEKYVDEDALEEAAKNGPEDDKEKIVLGAICSLDRVCFLYNVIDDSIATITKLYIDLYAKKKGED